MVMRIQELTKKFIFCDKFFLKIVISLLKKTKKKKKLAERFEEQ